MYKLLTSRGQLFAILLGAIASAIAIGSIVSGVNSKYSLSDDLNYILKNNADATFDFFNPAINITVVLVGIAAVAVVFFIILNLFTDLKGSMKILFAFLAVGLLFLIFYSTSDVETTGRIAMLSEKFSVGDGASKLISGGVKTAVMSIALAFGAAIIMEILNLLK